MRNHQVSINEAYIVILKNEFFLRNSIISNYRFSGSFSQINQKRDRKLLLKKNEMLRIVSQFKSKLYNLIPLKLFINERGWIKVEIALVRALKKYQKKAVIQRREMVKRLKRKEYD